MIIRTTNTVLKIDIKIDPEYELMFIVPNR